MVNNSGFPVSSTFVRIVMAAGWISVVAFFPSCDRKDPKPVNEEEIISTVQVTLTPSGPGAEVILKFFDEDGEHGSIAPVISASGPLVSAASYQARVEFLNETVTPAEDITLEVEEESGDHLICFDTSGGITVQYEDTDDHGLPLGLETTWLTGSPGQAEVTLTLRHQAGTKTGDCPGAGETDVEVTFIFSVE